MPCIGALSVTRQIYDEGGILGFWKGVVPTLLMVANPTVQYAIYEWLKARLAEAKLRGKTTTKRPSYSASDIFVMSALAKLGATVMTYPMQLVKSRLQVWCFVLVICLVWCLGFQALGGVL